MKYFIVHIFIIIVLISLNTKAQQKSWINTGGPYKGEAISIASSSNGLVLILTQSGIFRSTDNGINWKAINSDDWINHMIPDFPTSGQIIQSNGTVFLIISDSLLYRSTDNGDTWISIQPPDIQKIRNVASNSPNRIFALADSSTILYSTDNGDSWMEIKDTLNIDYINILTISLDNFLFLSASNGIYRSSDSGNSWINKTDLPMNLFTFTPDGTIYGTIKGFSMGRKIYKSTDNGDSWNESYEFPSFPPSPRFVSGLTSDSNGNVFFTTLGETYYLKNNDSIWHSIIYDYGYLEDRITAISSGNSGYVYVCLRFMGLFQTENAENWYNISPSVATIPLHQISAAPNGTIYVATDSGLAKSKDNGNTWKLGKRPAVLLVTTNSNNVVFTGIEYQGISRSTDEGETWTKITASKNIGIDMNDKLYNSYNHNPAYIQTSIDNGDNWGIIDDSSVVASSYAFYENNIFIGLKFVFYDHSIYGSLDGGNTWGFLTQGFPQKSYLINVNSLATNNDGDVFVAIDSGLFRSTDNGNYWIQIGQNLPKSIYTTLSGNILSYHYFGPEINKIISNNDTLYICYDRGVFYSTDKGDNWTSLNEGLGSYPDVVYLDKRPDGYLYLGTRYGTVFRYSSSITSTNGRTKITPEGWKLEQNYPNPFNPSTKINYSIPQTSFVTMKVFDILGREIATLVNEEKSVGNYQVVFNSSNLSSGIYFYQIKTENYIQTKKMLLLR